MTGYRPEFVYPFAVNGLLAVTQLIMVFYGYKFSNRLKLQLGFFMAALVMFSLPFSSHLGKSPTQKYWTSFGILFFFGFISGIVQGQTFSLAGAFPFKYMGAVMFGNGVSGISVNVLKAILQIIMPETEKMFTQSLIFFILSGCILLACSLMFSVANKNEFFNYYVSLKDGGNSRTNDGGMNQDLIEKEEKKGISFGEFMQQFKINMS